MEHLGGQPQDRAKGLARFREWWMQNGRSVMVVFGGAEAFEIARRAEERHTAPDVDPRRERFARWGQMVGDFRAGREQALADQQAGLVPDLVPESLDMAGTAPVADIDEQVGAMRDWLVNVLPEDFGTPQPPEPV